ncbi:hypothetical protein BFP72_16895 [Reichenbachiella sp. 5M10]|nr:hypothetical protein BFP72_16895 [Reichenbachiella sp. 5M10]
MLSFAVAGAAFAQTPEQVTPADQDTEMQTEQTNKKAIAMEEVPVEVQEGLEDTNIQTAQVEEVYQVEATDEVLYEFVVTIQDVKWAIQFDDQGNYVNKTALS